MPRHPSTPPEKVFGRPKHAPEKAFGCLGGCIEDLRLSISAFSAQLLGISDGKKTSDGSIGRFLPGFGKIEQGNHSKHAQNKNDRFMIDDR